MQSKMDEEFKSLADEHFLKIQNAFTSLNQITHKFITDQKLLSQKILNNSISTIYLE